MFVTVCKHCHFCCCAEKDFCNFCKLQSCGATETKTIFFAAIFEFLAQSFKKLNNPHKKLEGGLVLCIPA